MIDVIRIVDRENKGIFNSWIFDAGLFLNSNIDSQVHARYPALSTLIYATKHDVVCPCGEDFDGAVFLYKLGFVKSLLLDDKIFGLCGESKDFNLSILYGRVDGPMLYQDAHQIVVPKNTVDQLNVVGWCIDTFGKFVEGEYD